MKSNNPLRIGLTVAIWAAPLLAQQAPPAVQANPAPGCTATPAELEVNKKVAMEFFRTTGEARVALADPSYKQHNPAFKKRAEDNKVSDYEEFKGTYLAQSGRGGKKGAPATGPARHGRCSDLHPGKPSEGELDGS